MYEWLDRIMNKRLYRKTSGRFDTGLDRKMD